MDLSNVPIRPGGVLLVHSKITRLVRMARVRPEQIIASLLERVGPAGTLLLPLFNFDFAKGIPFDIRSTPSRMGALTEMGRLWPGAVRTGHPIYSFAAIGQRAELFRDVANRSGYGLDSPFAMIREMNGQIGVIDLPDQESMTFYHHVEEMLGVSYRYHKEFTGLYTDDGGDTAERTFSLFVRDIGQGVCTSVDRMGARLWEKGLYSGEHVGEGSGMRVIDAQALFEETRNVIDDGLANRFLYEVDFERA